MQLNLNQIRSIVEKNFIDAGLGAIPENADGSLPQKDGSDMTLQDVWIQEKGNTIPFTLREFRDMVSQCLFDILTDVTSTGDSLSEDETITGGGYGGGNRTEGSDYGNINLNLPSGQKITFDVDGKKITITDSAITFTVGTKTFVLDTNKTTITDTLNVTDKIEINGTKVIDDQQNAIADLTDSGVDPLISDKINEILSTLRAHGLIAT